MDREGVGLMTMQEALKLLIKETIAPLLKEKGFKKQGTHFVKYGPDFAWTMHIQSSKWNTREHVSFRFSIGIYSEQVYRTYYMEEPPSFPKDIHSFFRTCLSTLHEGKSDSGWYTLNKQTDVVLLKKTIHKALVDGLFVYIQKILTVEDVMCEIEKIEKEKGLYGYGGSPNNLTILYSIHGYHDQAQKRMIEVYAENQVDSFKKLTKEIADQLELKVE